MRFAPTTKTELREEMRARLAALTPTQVRGASAAIWERLPVLAEFAASQTLLVYVSKNNEVDTHGLIQQLLAMGKRVCVPAFDAAGQRYVASELRDFVSDLSEGKFGILEPKSGAMRVARADRIDALVLPGLAFDARGNRLGRGLGFFDRLLRDTHGIRIALAYEFQMLSQVPAEPHDVRVDFVVTESRVVNCKG